MVGNRVGDPDTVLLIDGESEGPHQLAWVLEWIAGLVLAEELDFGRIALGKLSEPGP